jgi:DNA-directed RNA polymerase subunit K/omega
MAVAKRAREIHELASEHCHRPHLARRQTHRARQTDDEGSNAIDTGWGDAAM